MALNRVGTYNTGLNWTGTSYTDSSVTIPSGAVKAVVFVLGGYNSINPTSVTIDGVGNATTFDVGSMDADGTNLYGAHVGLCEGFSTGSGKEIIWTADGDASEGMAGMIVWYDTDCEIIDVDTYFATNYAEGDLTSDSNTGDEVLMAICGYRTDGGTGHWDLDPDADQTDVISKVTDPGGAIDINFGMADADTVGATSTGTSGEAYYLGMVSVSIREVTAAGLTVPEIVAHFAQRRRDPILQM